MRRIDWNLRNPQQSVLRGQTMRKNRVFTPVLAAALVALGYFAGSFGMMKPAQLQAQGAAGGRGIPGRPRDQ